MRFFLVGLLVAPLVLAGCLTAPSEPVAGSSAPDDVSPVPLEPTVVEWKGHVVASAIDGPSHVRPTEDVLWPVQQEGFLFDVQELPEAFEVALEWEGEGEFMIMLHSHKEHGSNAYAEHVTELSTENPQCLRVPAEDLTTGEWQVMIHNRNARDVDFTIRLGLLGGKGAIVENERHGHWLHDGMFDVEEHEALPCEFLLGAPSEA